MLCLLEGGMLGKLVWFTLSDAPDAPKGVVMGFYGLFKCKPNAVKCSQMQM